MTKLNSGLFSSIKQDWKTPSKVYEELDKEFHFDFDPCPPLKKITWEDHGLAIEWGQCNFVNPPYSDIKRCVCKAYREYLKGKTVVMLIPSRTDTIWWHDFVMRASEIRFIKGRLKFNDEKNSAPFPSAIVVFKVENPLAHRTPTALWESLIRRDE